MNHYPSGIMERQKTWPWLMCVLSGFLKVFLFFIISNLCFELNLSSKKFSSDIVDLKLCFAKFSGPSPRGARARGFSLGKKPMNLALIEI